MVVKEKLESELEAKLPGSAAGVSAVALTAFIQTQATMVHRSQTAAHAVLQKHAPYTMSGA